MQSIAIITTHAPSLINFRALLLQQLVARGIKVFALAPNFDRQTTEQTIALGVIPIHYSMKRASINPLHDLWNTFQLMQLLKSLRPAAVLCYFIKPVIFGSIAALLAGVPRRFAMVEGLGFVFTDTGNPLTIKRRMLKKLVMWLYKIGMSCADRVIFLNPDDQAEFVNAGLLPASKSFLLGGIGVDLSQWPVCPPVTEPVTFLLAARLLREKGIEQYAAAARIVKARYPQARFILLGGLDENPGSISATDVQAWANEGILEWHGHVPVQAWLKQTSVYVLPSYREGVPVSTQEAMAMGRAVITTDVPGCRETVVDGVNGFLVPVRNPEALAQKMCVFIEQPELITTMGAESRRLAEERFDVHKVNARLLGLILGEAPNNG